MTQLAPLTDDCTPLPPVGLARLQDIAGALIHYACAVEFTPLVALGTFASAQTQGTEGTARAVAHLLDYWATNTDVVIHFHASDMCLHVYSDISYRLSKIDLPKDLDILDVKTGQDSSIWSALDVATEQDSAIWSGS
jgi:hypothetical protein